MITIGKILICRTTYQLFVIYSVYLHLPSIVNSASFVHNWNIRSFIQNCKNILSVPISLKP